jgi:hypothetical protein
LKKGKVEEAQNTLRKMMYMNNVSTAEDDIVELGNIIAASNANAGNGKAPPVPTGTVDFLS